MSGKTLADYESELWEDPRALLDLIAEHSPILFAQIEYFVTYWADVYSIVGSEDYGK